jgi:aryl-alcohol dehydrogenase
MRRLSREEFMELFDKFEHSAFRLETLQQYDALLLYANYEGDLAAAQEAALLDYVAGGGGFVAVHAASANFPGSDAYIELVGAQFESHGAGVFQTRIAEPDHEIMSGFDGFESWDETYVHRRHNPDRVVLSYTSCGSCRHCRGGRPAYCVAWVPANLITGVRFDGSPTVSRKGVPIGGHFFGQSSFAAHALADERSVVKVDADAPLEVLAPLGCAVQTGVGTVWNVLSPRPGASLAVFGAGAVGLSAVMAAHRLPLSTVVAVDRVHSRLELALELGATHVVDTGMDDVAKALSEITDGQGLDHAIDTTGVPALLRTAVDALGIRGSCAVVGAPPAGTEVSFEVQSLLTGKQIVGVTLGDSEPETLIPQLVDLHRRGGLPLERLVRHYPLDQLNAAAGDMHEGRTIKPVVTFDG